MKISGTQYYWIIAAGLVVGPILAVWIGAVGALGTDDPVVVIALLVAWLYFIVAGLVVSLEIRDRFGLGVAVLAFIASPALIVYWLSRINGVVAPRRPGLDPRHGGRSGPPFPGKPR